MDFLNSQGDRPYVKFEVMLELEAGPRQMSRVPMISANSFKNLSP